MERKEIEIKLDKNSKIIDSSWNPIKYTSSLYAWYYWGIRWIFSRNITNQKVKENE